MWYRSIRACVSGYVRSQVAMDRIQSVATSAIGGFLTAALSTEEQSDLGPRLYGFTQRSLQTGLFQWERGWFERALPEPPARLLVGGVGTGREAVSLAEQGYVVDAFEPGDKAAKICATQLRTPHRVWCGGYEDLAHAVLDHRGPLNGKVGRSYAAVIFGFGSLSHVLDPDHRARALRSASLIAPHGPVLVSFLLEERARTKRSASARWGQAVGAPIAKWRRITPSKNVYFTNVGFYHPFSPPELDALAETVGRKLRWEPDPGFPHATFLPPRAAAEPRMR